MENLHKLIDEWRVRAESTRKQPAIHGISMSGVCRASTLEKCADQLEAALAEQCFSPCEHSNGAEPCNFCPHKGGVMADKSCHIGHGDCGMDSENTSQQNTVNKTRLSEWAFIFLLSIIERWRGVRIGRRAISGFGYIRKEWDQGWEIRMIGPSFFSKSMQYTTRKPFILYTKNEKQY